MEKNRFVVKMMEDFAREAGLPPMDFSEEGVASLMVNGLVVHLRTSDQPADFLWVLADIGPVGAQDASLLLGVLGDGYLAWCGSGTAVAVREPESILYAYSGIPSVNLHLSLFKKVLAAVVRTAGEIRTKLETGDYAIV